MKKKKKIEYIIWGGWTGTILCKIQDSQKQDKR